MRISTGTGLGRRGDGISESIAADVLTGYPGKGGQPLVESAGARGTEEVGRVVICVPCAVKGEIVSSGLSRTWFLVH